MTFHTSANVDKTMTTEQFTQVVEAILAGKYSWACLLILRFAGYNPLHYIPYRTYNRLMKENNSVHYTKTKLEPSSSVNHHSHSHSEVSSHSIRDLSYLEPIKKSTYQIRGGNFNIWLSDLELN